MSLGTQQPAPCDIDATPGEAGWATATIMLTIAAHKACLEIRFTLTITFTIDTQNTCP